MLLGGREGRCETLDDEEASEMEEGDRDTERLGGETALPFGEETRFIS